MHTFEAQIEIIGINPFVFVPEAILEAICSDAGKTKGHIPICGTINNKAYKQTLVKYSGHWRLYINTTMLENSPKRIGERIAVSVAFDPVDRTLVPHPDFVKALEDNAEAKRVFETLPPSRQKEIVRYIASMKTPESLEKNVQRAIRFLLGEDSFIGRQKP